MCEQMRRSDRIAVETRLNWMSTDASEFVVVANRLPVDRDTGPDGSTWRTSPGGLVSALGPVLRRRHGVWIGWPGDTSTTTRRSTPTACRRCRSRSGPTRSRATTRACPTAPSGRCITTWSPNPSSTASGGRHTSRSTTGSQRRPQQPRVETRWFGSRTTNSSWFQRCFANCGPTFGLASSCTSRFRRPNSSSNCPGGTRSSEACSEPISSGSSDPAEPRTSPDWSAFGSDTRRTAIASNSTTAGR